MGSLNSLAKSIEAEGLIHPITITEDGLLVAGGRRLAAVQKLGWRKVPARRFERLTEEELRNVELAENVARLDLDSFEMSKQRLREIRQSIETVGDMPIVSGKRGPKADPRSDKSLSTTSGISRREISRTRRHVETAEEFPAMQGNGWRGA